MVASVIESSDNCEETIEQGRMSTVAVTTCPICYDGSKPLVVSTPCCSHDCCNGCIVEWILKEESTRNKTTPKCCFCRLDLPEDFTTNLLGRPFEPKHASIQDGSIQPEEQEVDELTQQWLDEQTRPCPSCNARIEKIDGCDLMECLCGFRFCYACGSSNFECSCAPGHGIFWDNVLDRETNPQEIRMIVAQNQPNEMVDLRFCIEQRRQAEVERLAGVERRRVFREAHCTARRLLRRALRQRQSEVRRRRHQALAQEALVEATLGNIHALFEDNIYEVQYQQRHEQERAEDMALDGLQFLITNSEEEFADRERRKIQGSRRRRKRGVERASQAALSDLATLFGDATKVDVEEQEQEHEMLVDEALSCLQNLIQQSEEQFTRAEHDRMLERHLPQIAADEALSCLQNLIQQSEEQFIRAEHARMLERQECSRVRREQDALPQIAVDEALVCLQNLIRQSEEQLTRDGAGRGD